MKDSINFMDAGRHHEKQSRNRQVELINFASQPLPVGKAAHQTLRVLTNDRIPQVRITDVNSYEFWTSENFDSDSDGFKLFSQRTPTTQDAINNQVQDYSRQENQAVNRSNKDLRRQITKMRESVSVIDTFKGKSLTYVCILCYIANKKLDKIVIKQVKITKEL